jgi:hypothetical protein
VSHREPRVKQQAAQTVTKLVSALRGRATANHRFPDDVLIRASDGYIGPDLDWRVISKKAHQVATYVQEVIPQASVQR